MIRVSWRAVGIAVLAGFACVSAYAAAVDPKGPAIEHAMSYAASLSAYDKGEVYESLARALADNGDFAQAFRVAKAADYPSNGLSYGFITQSASKQGRLDDDMVQSIRRVEGDDVLMDAANMRSAAGQFSKAAALLGQVDAGSVYKITLAKAWLQAGDVKRAAAVIEGTSGKTTDCDIPCVYLSIAAYLIRKQQFSEAVSWFRRGLDATKTSGGKKGDDFLYALETVIEAWHDVGDRVAARRVLWEAYGIGADPSVFASEYNVFQKTIAVQARLGLYQPKDDRARLIRLAKAVPGGWSGGGEALGLLANELAGMGDLEGALIVLPDVHGEQSVALASEGIAKAFAKADRIDDALEMISRVPPNPVWVDVYISPMLESIMTRLVERDMLQKADEIADGFADPSIRGAAQSILVKALVKAGRINDAIRIADRIGGSSSSLGVARGIGMLLKSDRDTIDVGALARVVNGTDFYRKGEALQAIVEYLVNKKLWKNATTTATGIEDPLGHCLALERVGVGLARNGLLADATKIADLLKGQQRIGDCRIRVVRAVVQGMIAAGRTPEAVRLVESAEDAKEKAWILVEVVKDVGQPVPDRKHR